MNLKKALILLAAGLIGTFALAACTSSDATGETGTATGTDTAKETEAVTAPVRYDYMEADVAADVTIEKSDYTDLKLTISNSLKVEKEDVDSYILSTILFKQRIAENGTTQVKDKALKQGDDAFIYYKGFRDGKEFDGGSNWDDETPYQLGLGSGAFIPGFEDALIGLIPQDTSKDKPAKIEVTFPEDYNSEDLAGQKATFEVAIMYAVQYKMPEYNRQFIEETLKYEPKQEFYASDRALIDEFEEFVRDTLVEQNESYIQNAKIDALWTHLVENVACKNLPELEIDYYTQSYTDEMEYYFDYYSAMGGEEFVKLYPDVNTFAPVFFGMEEGADWKAEIKAMAEKMVQKNMITHAIAEIEGMETVTDEEYQEQIDYWVSYYYGNMTEAEVVQANGEVFLKQSALATKMEKWLLDRVTFTYEDGTAIEEPAETESESETAA